MKYCFLFLDNEERKDPGKYGYNYAETRKNDWVEITGAEAFLTSAIKGVDFVHYNDKSYMLFKRYLDVESETLVVICTESPSSCDTRTQF